MSDDNIIDFQAARRRRDERKLTEAAIGKVVSFNSGHSMHYEIVAPCPPGAHIYLMGRRTCECGQEHR